MKYFYCILILIIGLKLNGQIYHEVKEKETLWSISVNYFGNGYEYIKIWQNSKTIGITDNPNLIYPGMILKIHTDSHFTVHTPRLPDSDLVIHDTVMIYLDTTTSKVLKDDISLPVDKENTGINSSLIINMLFPFIIAIIAAFLVLRYVSLIINRNTK